MSAGRCRCAAGPAWLAGWPPGLSHAAAFGWVLLPASRALRPLSALSADPTCLYCCLQGTAARRYWSCPGTADLRVRGRAYLADKKKIAAAQPMFDLYSAELVEVEEPMWHMARFLPSVK